jgi:hypothetical protein
MTKQNDSDRAGAILTLHRYFGWATTLQKRFREAGGCLDEAISEERASAGVDLRNAPADLLIYMDLSQTIAGDFGLYFFYYFDALYVVVEGFWDLKLKDDAVENLLKSRLIDALMRSRNGAFHFQREYLTPKLLDPHLSEDDFIDWAFALHDALRVCLNRELIATGLLS